jgi:hypothetical protein
MERSHGLKKAGWGRPAPWKDVFLRWSGASSNECCLASERIFLSAGDEVGHPGDGGDDERLSGGVDVGLRPRQHPHARHLTNKKSDLVRCFVRSHAQRRQGEINQLTVGIVDATVATAAALAPARVASACHAETQGTVRSEHNQAMATV